ncbi:response regulator transcription factor [Sphingomonas prati]|uniref:Two-component system nitrate/nitrite response regulator NarL n=1 Tax=Sphingomonas prati TaxID=1843237 RepID=A0A7W9BT80_9SPHN|nr:response regulator transcription factor [Sphingomonas prati]MBB5729687.1 two-component system nitrate/nitrite response regulator NarL [Sphingomonas prati]GGE90260.1 hypothetical protein GCM10011404_23960 [Sphingomonas prati]
MQQSFKVALLGPDSIVREGLRHILTEKHFDVTQSVGDLAQLSGENDDDLLIVVDGRIAADDAAGVRLLRGRFPDVKLVILSETFEFEAMASAFRAGVHGYICRAMSFGPLVQSLRLVAMGEKVMPSHLADTLQRYHDWPKRDHARHLLESANLSVREEEILCCLITGWSNKVISRRLDISESTVKVHVKAILRKLGVANRTQAAIYGAHGGLQVPRLAATVPIPGPKSGPVLVRAAG